MAQLTFFPEKITNVGERVFALALDQYLDDTHVVYWNREVMGREFDFCILLPDVGLVVVEVKGWNDQMILDVPGGQHVKIQTNHGIVEENPRLQARSYRFALLNHIKSKLDAYPLVFHMIAYPFLSLETYQVKHLDLISEPMLTFLADDLHSSAAFLSKVDQAVSLSQNWGDSSSFSSQTMDRVRSLFEPGYTRQADASSNGIKENRLLSQYSAASYMPIGYEKWREEVDALAQAYAKGTRIYALVCEPHILEYFKDRLTEVLKQKSLKVDKSGNFSIGIDPKLKISRNGLTIFNCQVALISDHDNINRIPSFMVGDGLFEEEDQRKGWLEQLDRLSIFNFAQYLVEHAPHQTNVLVKAGAGSGKTYVMILRVAYLSYVENITASNLRERIVMMTFTRDATGNMKKRLKLLFQNYYLLTGKYEYLEMLSSVDHMQIGTIHSYVHKMVESKGMVKGYGQHLKIKSGDYERQQILKDVLEIYASEHLKDSKVREKIGMPIYELRNTMLQFIKQIENKSLDLVAMNTQKFGDLIENPDLHRLIVSVIQETEKKFEQRLREDNSIHLSRLNAILLDLLKIRETSHSPTVNSKFLFVDEFQDTDDIQIDILIRRCLEDGMSMFVVGDLKQCIYRFRGAEEKAFDHLKISYPDPEKWMEFSLTKNFRTDRRLLAKFEENFSVWGQTALLPYNPSLDALVSNLDLNREVPENIFFQRKDIRTEAQRMPTLIEEIARYRDMLGDIPNPSQNDRTVAILVRTNEQVQMVTRAVEESGLIIQSDSGTSLWRTIPAIDLSVVLQALISGRTENLARLLDSNFFKVAYDRRELSELDSSSKVDYLKSLLDATLAQTAVRGKYESWSEVKKALLIYPVLQVLRSLYGQLTPWSRYSDRNRQSELYRINVDLIFEKILQNGNLESITLSQLSTVLTQNVVTGQMDEIRRPETEDNEIHIVCLTVHKAKGLEYGAVLLPFASFSTDGTASSNLDVVVTANQEIGYRLKKWHNTFYNFNQEKEDKQKEEARILYVAMTRAIRYFSWIVLLDSKSKSSWQSLLR